MFGVSMNDYSGLNGFGMGSAADMANLNKALTSGYAVTPDSQSGGGAFRVESLENSLKVLTFTNDHVKLWKKIAKLPAYNTVEEYNQLLSYGIGGGGFLGEGELPSTVDSSYQRRAAFVKFVGTTREVSHPMTLVRSAVGDVVSQYNQDGILYMMKLLENGLFWGNSKLGVGGSEYVEFDGLANMIDAGNTIDVKGQNFEEKHLNWGAQMLVSNYAIPTDLFLPFEVMGQFSEEFFPKERVLLPSASGYQAGVVVDKFQTHGGPVEFNPDIFLSRTAALPAAAVGDKAPGAPASVAATLNASLDGDFTKSGAGTYRYWVSLCNRYGESLPVQCTADVVYAGADLSKSTNVQVTLPASSTYSADFMKIYRTEANGGAKGFQIARIALTSNAASAVNTFKDTNYIMPNTFQSFMGEMNSQVIAFKQLAPIMKMDLATLAPAYRWMILIYGVPVLYAPKKWMKYINIKAPLYDANQGAMGVGSLAMNGAAIAPYSL